jgi:type I restriction enzyme, S subunit
MNNPVSDAVIKNSPADWDRVRLGELFESANVKLRDYDSGGEDVPVLSMTRTQGLILQSDKFDKRVASKDTSPYKVVKHGQLVIGFPIDEACIAILHRYPVGIVSPAYQVLSPVREIDLTFIDYYLRTPALIQIYRTFSSTVVERRRSISVRDFSSIEVPIPPLNEQHRIARVLNTVQTAIKQQGRLIALTSELKSTLLNKLFTEGLRGEKQKQTEIGLIPESWTTVKLGDLANIQTGKLDSNAATPFGQYPFFTCSQETARIDTYAFDTEAILLAGNNARGIYSVKHYKGKFNAYQRTYVLTQKDEQQMPYSFLLYALATNLEHLRTVSIGTSTKYLTLGILKNLAVIKPEYEEARDIGRTLALADEKIGILQQKKQVFEELFRTLLHQLMTAQIRVNEVADL